MNEFDLFLHLCMDGFELYVNKAKQIFWGEIYI